MATRALERGGLERHLVARAEVLETDATGVLVRTPAMTAVVRYQARAGRHLVEAEGHPGQVVLDAPPGVELRR